MNADIHNIVTIDRLRNEIVRLHQSLVVKDVTIMELTVERDRARRERDKLAQTLVDMMTRGAEDEDWPVEDDNLVDVPPTPADIPPSIP